MKLTKSLRMFGIATAFIGITASQSQALPSNELEVTYYSDETYSEEVGYMFRGCDGSVHREGGVSQYGITSSTPCHSSRPLNERYCRVWMDGLWYETTCGTNLCDSGLFECN